MWDDMEWNPDLVPPLKLGLHVGQIVLAFVAWCLSINVFTDDKADINGRNGWTFGVFFLSIPVWIFLVGAPRFPRTRKLAEPHAMVVLDTVFAIIFLSAFATQAAYNSAGKCGDACPQSKAIVGLDVFVFLLWCVTSFLSFYSLKYWQQHGRLPGYGTSNNTQNIDPDKAAFSMAPHDEESYAPVQNTDHDDDTTYLSGHTGASSSYGGLDPDHHDDNPFERRDTDPFHDNPYHSQFGSEVGGSSVYAPPPSTTPGPYDDQVPAQFPAANYDRVR